MCARMAHSAFIFQICRIMPSQGQIDSMPLHAHLGTASLFTIILTIPLLDLTPLTVSVILTSMKDVRVSIDKVPEDLRNNFRAWCVKRGSTMQKEFLKFMEWTAQKNQKGKIQ